MDDPEVYLGFDPSGEGSNSVTFGEPNRTRNFLLPGEEFYVIQHRIWHGGVEVESLFGSRTGGLPSCDIMIHFGTRFSVANRGASGGQAKENRELQRSRAG